MQVRISIHSAHSLLLESSEGSSLLAESLADAGKTCVAICCRSTRSPNGIFIPQLRNLPVSHRTYLLKQSKNRLGEPERGRIPVVLYEVTVVQRQTDEYENVQRRLMSTSETPGEQALACLFKHESQQYRQWKHIRTCPGKHTFASWPMFLIWHPGRFLLLCLLSL